MKTFPSDIQFRKPWRRYQQRVLSELDDYLDDNHLHIVAAPGSGKTVLGLEVVRRLNRPTLIFTPTVAIRDQWIDRLVGLFSDRGPGLPDWVSRDIRDPRFLTVSTYQGLHSVYSGQEEEEEDQQPQPAGEKAGKNGPRSARKAALLKKLGALDVRTLVLDEAHHLRNEWWRCLIDVKKNLNEPTVVALTATAPFDVSPFEWDRYVDLCGSIDAEITVPELVQERNLCPHQDYVYISTPLRAEQAELAEFRRQVDASVKALTGNEAFIQALEGDRRVVEPGTHVEEILADPGFYSSVAIFLSHVRGRPPRKLLAAIGFSRRKCRPLTLEWLQTLLTGCLYSHAKSFEAHKGLFQQIARDLKRIGAIERRTVSLRSTSRTAQLLTRSASKLKSIEDIVEMEGQSLGPALRMVVLTDFVRSADFPRDTTDTKDLKRLGVVPIFEQIRRSKAPDVRLGILTGTLTVVPSDTQESLRAIGADLGIDSGSIAFKPLAHDERFCEVVVRGADKQKIVALVTNLFRQGGVTVLVGTTSLLGEGWDAPSVNTLILASFVGSYMLSNQMRGRAIRTEEGHPTKTANIWHLVCQETGVAEPGEDLDTLMRRFKAFVGVSFKRSAIESGLSRLGLGNPPYDPTRIDQINATMTQQARDRGGLRTRWELALGAARIGAMAEEVTTSQLALPRDFVVTRTVLAVLWQVWFWGVSAFSIWMSRSAASWPLRVLMLLLAAVSALAAVAALPKFFKALWLLLRHGSVASSMKQIGNALLKALVEAGVIDARRARPRVIAQRREYGLVACSVKGGSTRERSVFLEALQELLGPIDDPRYLLVRKSPLGPFMRKDYHAVPRALAKNKESAEHFRRMWARYIGPCEALYTRNPQGRQTLLKARAQSVSTAFHRRTDRTRTWR
ncbi:MAG: DEAD/DEAH box helicase family protein [Sedimentisphaerales bacterium]|nr:DEAD/DEAH box helicase family protein [Sedimentisphaerales bacterium]NLT77077.1 DEAD/DEAH box helicase family protein [Planctomycetota bacterium]